MPVLFALSTLATILIIPCVVVVLLLLFGVGVYNSLVTLRNRYRNAFSQIDVQLKRRYDLIPNLVETAKGYMRHESPRRSRRSSTPAIPPDRQPARCRLAGRCDGDGRAAPGRIAALGTLGRMFALAESYPDLKANQNMLPSRRN